METTFGFLSGVERKPMKIEVEGILDREFFRTLMRDECRTLPLYPVCHRDVGFSVAYLDRGVLAFVCRQCKQPALLVEVAEAPL